MSYFLLTASLIKIHKWLGRFFYISLFLSFTQTSPIYEKKIWSFFSFRKIQLWQIIRFLFIIFSDIFLCYVLRIPISFRVLFASKSLLSITKQWITVSLFITFLIKFHHIFIVIVLSICDFTAFFLLCFPLFYLEKLSLLS